MSRLPDDSTTNNPLPTDPDDVLLAGVFSIAADNELIRTIKDGYKLDPFCVKLNDAPDSCPGLRVVDGLMYLGDHLIIPRHGDIREMLFLLDHDSLGHFGFEKSYGTLRDSYYWPRMQKDLEEAYIPSCAACQRNKSPTQKPVGPLHPTPVPDGHFKSIAMDFIGPLPWDEGFDEIVTITDMLGADYRFLPCKTTDSASDFALRFFNGWYCEHGLPEVIFSDRNKLFVSKFWKALTKLTGSS